MGSIEVFKDPIGGLHSECIGTSPDGVRCGECSEITCELCLAHSDLAQLPSKKKCDVTRTETTVKQYISESVYCAVVRKGDY